jgi:hypothetical protein
VNRRLLLCGSLGSLLAARAAPGQYQPQGRALVARLAALQAEDGALLMPGDGAVRVCRPWEANVALRGLLLGAPPRARREAAGIALRWLRWCQAHVVAGGALEQHEGPPGALTPAVAGEHRDAAGGSFLSFVAACYHQTGDGAAVEAALPLVRKVAGALERGRTGLTRSRAEPGVSLLINNLEAWQGFDTLARLYERMRRRAESESTRAAADALLAAIDRWFWAPEEGHYAWSRPERGRPEGGLARWSPNRLANLMAAVILPRDDRRETLLQRLAHTEARFPEKITAAQDLERLIWWGLAPLAAGDAVLLEQYQVRLSKVAWDELREVRPSLLGLALRLGGARAEPPQDAQAGGGGVRAPERVTPRAASRESSAAPSA